MNNHEDNGSFATGVIMTVLMVASAFGGYWIRDLGIKFSVDRNQAAPIQREVRK